MREYTEQHYVPAATAYRERVAYNGALGTSIVNWQHSLKDKWRSLKFGDVNVQSNTNEHLFEAEVYLDGLDPNFVRVELYADGVNGDDPIRQQMTRNESEAGQSSSGDSSWLIYRGSLPSTRPANHFTPRVVPNHVGVAIPLELNLICWQK